MKIQYIGKPTETKLYYKVDPELKKHPLDKSSNKFLVCLEDLIKSFKLSKEAIETLHKNPNVYIDYQELLQEQNKQIIFSLSIIKFILEIF